MTHAADPFFALIEAGEHLLPASFFDLAGREGVHVYASAAPGDVALLSDDERARLATFGSAGRRAEFVRGRSLLRSVLAPRLATSPEAVPLRRAVDGGFEPVEGELHLSLSHTGTVAAVVMAPHPVGLDVEQVRPVSAGLVARMCAPGEAVPTGEVAALCTWAAKEAVLKARGEGLRGGLRQVRLRWHIVEPPLMRATAESPQQPFAITVRQTSGLVWALALPETGAVEGRSASSF